MSTALVLLVAFRMPARRAAVWMSLWAFLSIALSFYWAPEVLAYTVRASFGWGVAISVPLALWDALRLMLPLVVARLTAARLTTAWLPAALTAVVAEAIMPGVFPWRTGYSQVAWTWIVQSVDLFGPEWSTFIFFAHVGALLFLGRLVVGSWLWPRASSAGQRLACCTLWGWLPLVICAANLLYGGAAVWYWNRQVQEAPIERVALVQNDPTYRESVSILLDLTRKVGNQVDLVCWPEGATAAYEESLDRFTDPTLVWNNSIEPNRGLRPWPDPGCELLTGAQTYAGDPDQPDRSYQSALLIDAQERIVRRYHKRHLMPFGEYVPGRRCLPALDEWFSLAGGIDRGEEATVLATHHGARIGVLLCYEDMLTENVRASTNNGANLLACLINASAFENPLTLRQHRMLAQLRAVECRRSFVRCAATGETCYISPTGVVERRLPLQTPGVLTAEVPLVTGETLYCRTGNLLPYVCGVALALVGFRARRERGAKPLAA